MKYMLGVFATILFLGCDKGEPLISVIPEISVIKVEPTSLVEFQDSLIVTMLVKDGDGNVGFTDPDSMALRVKDSRLTKPDWYFIKPQAPIGSNVAINDTIRFRLHGTFLFGQGNSESAKYTIDLRDRSGNWSNIVTTPTITITR